MCAAQAFITAPEGASRALAEVLLCNQLTDIEALCQLLKEKLMELCDTGLQSGKKLSCEAPVSKAVGSTHSLAEISEILCGLGMPTNLLGYQYLRHAIFLAVAEPDILRSVTKELYPRVAAEFGTTTASTERAMRHAIEVVWDRGNVDALHSYFGFSVNPSRGKPTNSEFISKIADNLSLGSGKMK